MAGRHNDYPLFIVMSGRHNNKVNRRNSSLFHQDITTTHCLSLFCSGKKAKRKGEIYLFRSDITTKRKGEILRYFA